MGARLGVVAVVGLADRPRPRRRRRSRTALAALMDAQCDRRRATGMRLLAGLGLAQDRLHPFAGAGEMAFAGTGQRFAALPQRQRVLQARARPPRASRRRRPAPRGPARSRARRRAVVVSFSAAMGPPPGERIENVEILPPSVSERHSLTGAVTRGPRTRARTAPSASRTRRTSPGADVVGRPEHGRGHLAPAPARSRSRGRGSRPGPRAVREARRCRTSASRSRSPPSTTRRPRPTSPTTSSSRTATVRSGSASAGRERSRGERRLLALDPGVQRAPRAASAGARGARSPRRGPGTIDFAASVGVAARRSATWSTSGVSGSCPIAVTTGVRQPPRRGTAPRRRTAAGPRRCRRRGPGR